MVLVTKLIIAHVVLFFYKMFLAQHVVLYSTMAFMNLLVNISNHFVAIIHFEKRTSQFYKLKNNVETLDTSLPVDSNFRRKILAVERNLHRAYLDISIPINLAAMIKAQ